MTSALTRFAGCLVAVVAVPLPYWVPFWWVGGLGLSAGAARVPIGRSWQDAKGRCVSGLHDSEVLVIDCGDIDCLQPLCHSHNGGVRATQRQICILAYKIHHPHKVGVYEIRNPKCPARGTTNPGRLPQTEGLQYLLIR